MKLIYISQGNIPSKWAHSIQTMKMAQAFSKLVPKFQLVTQGSVSTLFRRDLSAMFEMYGIRRPFCIKRLPLYLNGLPEGISDRDYFPRFVKAAVAYARLHRSLVVYTREFHVAYLATRWGIPTILERHGGSEHTRFHFMLKTIGNPKLLGIVTISEKVKDEYVKQGVPAERILVRPSAVDLALFDNVPGKTDARKYLGIDVHKNVAMYVGHLYRHKGVQYLIQTAKVLPEVDFIIVGGWAKDRERLMTQAEGIKNITFIEHVPNGQVPLFLAAADVLLLPNSMAHPEATITSPLKLFEYMAARRPIIASDIPAFRGILNHGRNAFVVKPDSPEAIAEGVSAVCVDKTLAFQLAEMAWRDVQNYTWEKRARSILEQFMPGILDKG